MFAPAIRQPEVSASQNQGGALELANRLFREFHTQCFWHSPHDLVITDDLIPFVARGLRTYGGGNGFKLAGELQPKHAESFE